MNSHNKNSLTKTPRIESIDIIRGITILVMIFVNDLSGDPDSPSWMQHARGMTDGMTFVDWVFPAFLFIVGMSMPFSIGRRIERGENQLPIWKHILVRVAGLLLLGFFMVNGDRISGEGILAPPLWVILMYVFIIILWNKNTDPGYFLSKKWIKYSAAAGLILLVFLYTTEGQTGFIQMSLYWWGILGLIGWAYLFSCLIYLPLRKNQAALIASAVLLYFFYMAFKASVPGDLLRTGFFSFSYTLGTHTAIVLTGAILGNRIREHTENPDNAKLLKWAFGFSLFLFIAGLLLHQLNKIDRMFIVSKNLATAPWGLYSSAFTVWLWMAVYWLADMKNFNSWFKITEPAGKNPLFAYILAPFMAEFFALTLMISGFNIYVLFEGSFFLALLRAVVTALFVTWLSGYLVKKGLQLKL
ncbi:MAG: DUF5009 domain-containing protein [Ignavibacteriaceae bacterium]